MTAVLVGAGVALVITLFGTPALIRLLVRREYGQFIRQDGPTSHQTKRGTPTMGGVIIILATVLGYAVANIAGGALVDAAPCGICCICPTSPMTRR